MMHFANMLPQLFLASSLHFTAITAARFTTGQNFQIILNSVVDLSKPLVPDVPIYDIDMADTSASTIGQLKSMKKIVICYFSAGTYEDWRSDASQFSKSDLGANVDGWPGERWLNIRSSSVRSIMKTRIQLAASKGCDAIDPDNTDVYQNNNGLGITSDDTIDYIKWIANTAAANGLQVGLKNSIGILSDVQDYIQFAVNEECIVNNECDDYNDFLASGKPVFHIEYPSGAPSVASSDQSTMCQNPGPVGMSTVLKKMNLDGWVKYCSGSTYTTSVSSGGSGGNSGGSDGSGASSSSSSSSSSSTSSSTSSFTSSSTSTVTYQSPRVMLNLKVAPRPTSTSSPARPITSSTSQPPSSLSTSTSQSRVGVVLVARPTNSPTLKQVTVTTSTTTSKSSSTGFTTVTLRVRPT